MKFNLIIINRIYLNNYIYNKDTYNYVILLNIFISFFQIKKFLNLIKII